MLLVSCLLLIATADPSTPERTTVSPIAKSCDVDVVNVPTKLVIFLNDTVLVTALSAVDGTLLAVRLVVNVVGVGVSTTSCTPLNVESTLNTFTVCVGISPCADTVVNVATLSVSALFVKARSVLCAGSISVLGNVIPLKSLRISSISWRT